jgi:uncharacterized membrane protein HdeD (DUF308 family)
MSDKLVSRYNLAGLFVILSGVLHIPMFITGGFTSKTIQMAVVGVILILLGLGLRKQKRILAYLAYVLMLLGVVAALTGLNAGPVPNVWWYIIAFVDAIAAITLFGIIWVGRKSAASA